MSSESNNCTCQGSFKNIVKGPYNGVFAVSLGLLTLTPVLYAIQRLWSNHIEFQEGPLDGINQARLRKKLIISGCTKIATRSYAALYLGSAAGSAFMCNSTTYALHGAVLCRGYGLEASALAAVVLCAGFFDWISLWATKYPAKESLSKVRWEIILQRRVNLCIDRLFCMFLILLLATFGGFAHVAATYTMTDNAILSIAMGIFIIVVAFVVCYLLHPSLLVAETMGHQVQVPHSSFLVSWEVLRIFCFQLPGAIISISGFSWASLVGWLLELVDSVVDFGVIDNQKRRCGH